MELGSSLPHPQEPATSSATQGISRTVWNLEVHYHIHKSPPPPQLLKEFPALYGTWKFITTSTRARHLYLSWARSIQPMPLNPTSFTSILIVYSHLCLGLSGGVFPSGFSPKTLYAHLLFPKRATCPAHLILLYLITWIIFGERRTSRWAVHITVSGAHHEAPLM